MLSLVNQKLALVRPGLQSNFIGDNPGVMVYALRFCLYLLVAGAGAFAFSVWLTPVRPVVNAVLRLLRLISSLSSVDGGLERRICSAPG